ncbi:MAG: carbohydrate ABC transporter permease [Chloroflexi bacterium]|nr:carbohydrate ABC transporter permease [Chloroflexota bacterium]
MAGESIVLAREEPALETAATAGRARLAWKPAVLHALLLAGALLMLFPFYWMVVTAFKDLEEASAFPPTLWPSEWHPENFLTAWGMAPFGRYFVNTILVAGLQTTAVLLTSALAAYALARIDFKGKNLVFVAFLATLMIPFEVTLVPNFVILKTLQWYNTYLALIVPWGTSVFAIFLLRQFFLSIPKDLYDAAEIDGCSRFQFLWRIALPLSTPALVTIALLSFLGGWNALLWPLIVTGSAEMRLLQVGLSAFQSEARVQYHLWMAAATFTTAPVIVAYFFAQRHFIQSVSGSGLKG